MTEAPTERWLSELQTRIAALRTRLDQERAAHEAIDREARAKLSRQSELLDEFKRRFEAKTTTGQRIADAVARVGGSWSFVLGFLTLLAIWISFNTARGARAFDPYPFILLNLALSMIAALQAPIIMMAQNRAAEHDRAQAEQDFRINARSEAEVDALQRKLDHLLRERWITMVELQHVQLTLLQLLHDRDRGTLRPT